MTSTISHGDKPQFTFKELPLGSIVHLFVDGDWIESKDQSLEGIRLLQTGNIGQGVFLNKGDRSRYISQNTFLRS